MKLATTLAIVIAVSAFLTVGKRNENIKKQSEETSRIKSIEFQKEMVPIIRPFLVFCMSKDNLKDLKDERRIILDSIANEQIRSGSDINTASTMIQLAWNSFVIEDNFIKSDFLLQAKK